MNTSIVYLASDHRGFQLKSKCLAWLHDHGYTIKDLGTESEERCDAGDFAIKLASELGAQPGRFGVLICGSGHAMAMTANRYRNVRAVQCTHSILARAGREHNDANVLVMGADIIGPALALECLEVFLSTKFLEGRYADRRNKLTALGGL